MPSPFPGMNPYLEASHLWEDFHARLANEISDQLTPRLRPRYLTALTPRVTYEEVSILMPYHAAKPDVGIYQITPQPLANVTTLAAPAPITREVTFEEPFYEYALEIRETATGVLVTAIEILSPINKQPGRDAFDAYRRKRREPLRTDAHLLEIDLLRAGRRPVAIDDLPDAPYFVFLSREERRGMVEIWSLHFHEPLPLVPVPLRPPDPDVSLDLGSALNAIYDRAAYDLRLDYTQSPPEPLLSAEDSRWLHEHLHAQALR